MKYCNCKIQNAPIYKKIKGVFYFVCYRCGNIRITDTKYFDGYMTKLKFHHSNIFSELKARDTDA